MHPVKSTKIIDRFPLPGEFEICSWRINEGKNDLTPEELAGLCGNVAAHRSRQSAAQ